MAVPLPAPTILSDTVRRALAEDIDRGADAPPPRPDPAEQERGEEYGEPGGVRLDQKMDRREESGLKQPGRWRELDSEDSNAASLDVGEPGLDVAAKEQFFADTRSDEQPQDRPQLLIERAATPNR